MKTFRIVKGELFKIFLRPGIFIMTGFLVLILAIAPVLYNPNERTDLLFTLSGNNVTEKLNSFNTQKSELLSQIDQEKNNIDYFLNLPTGENPLKEINYIVYNETADYYGIISSYKSYINSYTESSLRDDISYVYNNSRTLITKLNDLKTKLSEYIDNVSVPAILITQDNYENLVTYISDFIKTLEATDNKSIDSHENAISYINSKEFITKIKNSVGKIKLSSYSKTNLENLITDYFQTATNTNDGVLLQIENELLQYVNSIPVEEYNLSKRIKDVESYARKYYYKSVNIASLLREGLLLDVTKNYSDSEISQYIGFEDFIRYEHQEIYAKNKLLFEKNTTIDMYATPFAFNTESTADTNYYDYMYFVLELFSIVLIVYGVVLAAGMIASEQTNGTLKMLAIRPYSRNKIAFGKLFTTMFFVTIFILLSALISMIIGMIMFSGEVLPVLAVFNGTNAFVISPALLFIIYLITLWLKVFLFVLIAFAISTLFRSHAGAVIISVLIYIMTMLATFLAGGQNWLKYIPFVNFDLYKYFGGSYILQHNSSNIISNLFVSPVFSDTSILYSSIIMAGFIIIMNLIIYGVFKNRDIN